MAPYKSPPFWEWLAIYFHYGVIVDLTSRVNIKYIHPQQKKTRFLDFFWGVNLTHIFRAVQSLHNLPWFWGFSSRHYWSILWPWKSLATIFESGWFTSFTGKDLLYHLPKWAIMFLSGWLPVTYNIPIKKNASERKNIRCINFIHNIHLKIFWGWKKCLTVTVPYCKYFC